ncbi:response regulator [Lyngbya confervoides]|uniref:histidine kinase n=1 Tax=Lyngbya confervoides BDU141951 TaxID=1574623 RepID=A0ABD4T038_9CYAN|nr:response regulator [Lyngbya confervoides]MCM1981937.1 PAS domain S-box protein [Lyngbya confervoides BDU141951]
MRILVVEDEAPVAQAIEALLVSCHYSVDVAADGLAGLEMAEAYRYDLMLLDIGLPRMDGVRLCQQLRTSGIQSPILLLTGQEAEAKAKATALNAGADDYLTKPFDAEELLARIQSLLRRGALQAFPVLRWGSLSLDPSRLQVSYGATLLQLTPKEYSLLEVLLRHAPNILNARTIVEQGWSALEAPGNETVRTHLKKLRKKLKAAGAPEDFIKTLHRQGYRLNPLYGDKAFSPPEQSAATLQMAELKAVNEELRQTLAQLHATQAELQQKNQELQAVQEKLTDRIAERTAELSQREAFLRSIYDGAAQPIFVVAVAETGDFRYVSHNRAAQEMTGIALVDVQGKTPEEVFGPEIGSRFRQHYQQCVQANHCMVFENHFVYQDRPVWFLTTLSPVRDAAGKIDRLVGTVLETSQWKRLDADRKQAEAALYQSEAQLSRILDNVGVAIGELAAYADGTYVHKLISLGCESVYGYSQAEIIGDQELWRSRVLPEDVETVIMPAFERIFAEQSFTIEYRFRDKTDSVRWISETLTSQWDEAAACWQVTTVGIHISDRKQAELALQQKIRQEQLLVDIAQEIRQSLELDQVLHCTVERVREWLACDRVVIFRFRPDWKGDVIMESVGKQWPALQSTTIDDPCFADQFIQPYLQGHVSILRDINQPGLEPCYVDLLQQFQVKASLAVPILLGHDLWGLLITHQCDAPRQWEPAEIELLQRLAIQVGIASQQSELYEQTRDELSARQHMQAVLEASEARFRSLSAAAPIGICQTNADGICLYVNPCWLALSGLSLKDCLGNGWLQAVHPEDRHRLGVIWERVLKGDSDRLPEFRLLTPQGEIRWISAHVASIQSTAGEIVGYVSTHEDITERKQAEQALRESEQRLQAILDHSPAVIYLLDHQNRHLLVNHSYAALLSISAQDLVGKGLQEVWPPEMADRFATQNRAVLETGQLLQIEDTLPLPDGIHSFITVKFPLSDATGTPYALCGISTDITEKKNLEAQFYQAQRLESLGILAGGIAHDLNNMLTPILGMTQVLQMTQRGLDARGIEQLQIIESSAKRGANLVKQILSVTRASQGQQTAVNLAALLQEEIKIVQQSFPKSIEIQVEIPTAGATQPALGKVLADPTYLHQIVMNLYVNARDAMPNGGTLGISAQNVWVDEAMAAQTLDARVGRYALITVTDTGTGITPEVQERMFDPFFTTKPPGQGTGLGLATVRSLVKANQGFVQVVSQVGQGTQFKVYFPQMEDSVPDSDLAGLSPALMSETHEALVLVVEDEEIVRMMLQSFLESHHYRTLLAQDGVEALEQYQQHRSEIQLVLSDLMMPNMDGFTLIRRLKAMDPAVYIVALSGVPTHEATALAAGASSFLAKPFDLETLLSHISTCFTSMRA